MECRSGGPPGWSASGARRCGTEAVPTVRRNPYREEESLRRRLRELAAARPRFGYRRLHVLLRREGVIVNHKRVERLYREEGLAVRRRRRKRVARDGRGRAAVPGRPNQQW